MEVLSVPFYYLVVLLDTAIKLSGVYVCWISVLTPLFVGL